MTEAPIDELQSWLFQQLRKELLRRDPGILSTIDVGGETTLEQAEQWGSELAFPQVQPWNRLIAQLLSLRLRLMQLIFVTQSLKQAETGIGVWFFELMEPLEAHSCLEIFKRFLTTMGRIKPRVIAPIVVGELTRETDKYLAQLRALRDQAGHGADIAPNDVPGWIAEPAAARIWELMALHDEAGLDSLHDWLEKGLTDRDTYVAVIVPFANFIGGFVEEALARVLNEVRQAS